jgi:hypothetical protein
MALSLRFELLPGELREQGREGSVEEGLVFA